MTAKNTASINFNLVNISVEDKPIPLPIRFNKENVVSTKSIVGRGQFAISYMLGRIEIDDNINTALLHPYVNVPILFKSVNMDDEERCFKALVRELNILENLRPHPNILNLVGSCTHELKHQEIYLAFEFCGHGNLLKYLRHCNPLIEYDTFREIITNTEGGPVLTLTRYRLLQWASEITCGMEYLASKQICHNDLAARNILVTNAFTAKICNFSLAQKLPARDGPHNLQKIVLPLKWMAPEAIRILKYSVNSDIWSLGVTLWEIYTIGEIPYRHLKVCPDFWKVLLQGMRLSKPHYASADVWKIIYSCWEYNADLRPSFTELRTALEKGLDKSAEDSKTVSNRGCNMNNLGFGNGINNPVKVGNRNGRTY